MQELLTKLGLEPVNHGSWTGVSLPNDEGALIPSHSPANGLLLGHVRQSQPDDYDTVITTAQEAFLRWRMVPAPKRGEVVRQFGNALRDHKEALGDLVSLEMGKIRTEGHGEVQR